MTGRFGFSQGVQIQGKWKYSFSDNREFSGPGYNDSEWKEIDGRLSWQKEQLPADSRVVWLRKSIVFPSSLKKEAERTGLLVLSLGRIQQTDQTYLNGKLIGKTESGDLARNYLIYTTDIQ